ncbi:ArsR/SmtB family transcription factor [Peptoniphilus indolicus]|uniref:Metal transport repressor protein CzrA n=2 Tax=Peptoniphilus indolicus TaxID=33030 RepID=G4D4P7_9FIRM|nr:metalloregulator ArsR/SmtB family transcription factor [Peptoniphilus indolicus]EGY79505.1 metal transport repressor protein CzrA [Peptoniphilus indolicus ATCC 29427]SUB74665.1 Transcriptional repressor smtB homolog [Peptoniphilus indolicus]
MSIEQEIREFSEHTELIDKISIIFKSMGDPTRIKILYALSKGPMNVTQISNVLQMSQSSISHQLAVLRSHNIIRVERVARNAIYSLDDEHIQCIFKDGLVHAKHRLG